LILNIYIIKE